jgi:hypothetical protein
LFLSCGHKPSKLLKKHKPEGFRGIISWPLQVLINSHLGHVLQAIRKNAVALGGAEHNDE